MKLLLPIFFIIVSVVIFFAYIDGAYQDIRQLRAEIAGYDEALKRSKELQAIRDTLLSRYNTFSQSQLDRIEKLLPDNIDNVRLVLEIDSIAARYGMRVSSIVVSSGATTQADGVVGPGTDTYNTVELSFRTAASYDDFMAFLRDLESSLRIVDVTSLAFSAPDGIDADGYEYSLSIITYWLK